MDITAGDGHTFTAYRAEPAEAPKAAVIVLHEIFGINADIRQTADALAKLGYLAVVPSLFDRVQKDVSLGYAAEAVQQGLDIVKQIPLEKSLADLQATVETVASAGKVGVLGFDWGAFVAFHAANRVSGLACAVAYYGAGIPQPPLPNGILARKGSCYDLAYAQGPTPFVRWGYDAGAVICMDGLGMLVEQAAEAFRIWRGIYPETAPVIALINRERGLSG